MPTPTYAMLMDIAVKAFQIGMPMYLVGGSVRDILLGEPAKDLDIVVEGDASVLAFEVARGLSGESACLFPVRHREGEAGGTAFRLGDGQAGEPIRNPVPFPG